jgi:hypothetical protein
MTNLQSSRFWFKRRRYGWGWMPCTWQGWVTVAVFIGIVVIGSKTILPAKPAQPSPREWTVFFGLNLAAVLFLIIVALVKGPIPRWRWGWKPGDNPDEDF